MMAVRHGQRTCEICGLPGGVIRRFSHPNRLQLIEAHPSCTGEDHELEDLYDVLNLTGGQVRALVRLADNNGESELARAVHDGATYRRDER